MRLQKRSGCGGSQVVCHPFFSGCSGRVPQLPLCGGGAWRSHGRRAAEVRAGSGARAVRFARFSPQLRSCGGGAWRSHAAGPRKFGPVRALVRSGAERGRFGRFSPQLRSCGGGAWRSHGRRAAEVRAGSGARAVRCGTEPVPSGRAVRAVRRGSGPGHPPPSPSERCGRRDAASVRRGLRRALRCVPPFLLRSALPAAPRPFCCIPALLRRPALPTAPRRFSRRPSRRPLRRPSRCGAAACRA